MKMNEPIQKEDLFFQIWLKENSYKCYSFEGESIYWSREKLSQPFRKVSAEKREETDE